jgi:TPR repeat protein
MKAQILPLLLLPLLAVSCRGRGPKAPKAVSPAPVCEKRDVDSCLTLARGFEEAGNSRYLEAYEAACALGSAEACERVLAEVELTVLAAPTPALMEIWNHRLASLCASGRQKACVFRDLLTFSEPQLDATAMRKSYFRLQEGCRQDADHCVSLVQALALVARKNSAFFKQNAMTGYQTACHAGIGEACLQDSLLQRDKRDLEWTLSYLLKGCELGETVGCDLLVSEARRAVIEGRPRHEKASRHLKPACQVVEHRASCLAWAEGHVRGWWEGVDPAAGHEEHRRQCGLGAETACLAFARRLLDTAPDQHGWARQILRQTCSEGHAAACALLAQAVRRPGEAQSDREAVDILRASCYGPGGAQPNYYSEYDYQRSSYNNTFNHPGCALLGRFLLEGIGVEVNETIGLRLLSSGCAGTTAGEACLFYGRHLRKLGQVNASAISPIYERICLAGNEEGCFALADLHKTGYKEVKPSEAQDKKYRAMGCRLAPGHPTCKSGQ